jgi:post-segregation antitoxin (ccd killing protein)
MTRARISTTVDQQLLEQARQVNKGVRDSALIDDALAAFLARHRAAQVDAAYASYDDHPLGEEDDWGDLASFRAAAAAS